LLATPLPGVALKGFAIGNPFTDEVIDSNSQIDYDYSHGLISIEAYTAVQRACSRTVLAQCLYYDKCADACGLALDAATAEANTSALDPYYLTGDKCLLSDDQIPTLQHRYVRPMHRGVVGPCAAQFAAAYLSQSDVQAAIHATSGPATPWRQCNFNVSAAYTRTFSALPKYPHILRAGLKALIYSGDVDSVVNFVGTQRWLTTQGLNLSVVDKWHAWFGPDKQLAGYTEGYTNVTFTTIKGAGHMVPAVRPLHALYLFECFVFGHTACGNFTYPQDELEYLTGAAPDFFDRPSSNTALWVLLAAAGVVAVVVAVAAWRKHWHRRHYPFHLYSQMAAHLITDLPGLNASLPFKQYAGQLPLPSTGQQMFYWHVEAEENPSTAPLVLWLNGGPGCSSLIGFFTELGPFAVNSDLTLKRNPYAWNRKVNMVFLESPAGVGFSAPLLNATEYNDDVTTDRAYEFLQQFYETYPAYKGRDLFITGESYAGMYLPWLAAKLVATPLPAATFKGFALGNGYTDEIIDGNSYIDYLYTHALLSLEDYRAVGAACPANEIAACQVGKNCSAACESTMTEALARVNMSAMNEYYIYGDVCLFQDMDQVKALRPRNDIRPMHRGVMGPCADLYTAAYLQQPTVQAALHLPPTQHTEWASCNDAVSDAYTRSVSALPKYPALLASGINMLVYSGDADTNVNFLGTQRWLADLKLPVVDKWHAWFGPDKQLAGYTEGYTNVTFTTIKGAGHMVPATRPLHALYMFECFVFGDKACANFSYPVDELQLLTGAATTGSLALWQVGSEGHVSLLLLALVAAVVAGVVVRKARGAKAHYTRIHT
ncbi:serine protease family S10, partial [Achlya hypogyna]